MKVTGNVKYIPAGTTQYVVDGNDGQINVDTSVSAVTIILPNIINSGYANTEKGFIVNDISNNAATNNITIVASNNTTNSQSSVLISVNGGTAKCSIASLNEWFVITEPTTSGMSGNLTANYIPKAVTSSTLGNSVIYQNGSNIGINTTNPLTKLTVSANDQSSLISSVRYENVGSSPAGIVSLRARGTDLLPTALVTGDEIATFAAVGYYGAGFGTTGDANFIFYAAENFTLTNRGTSCKVGTTPLGTSSVIYNFGINSEGNVSIGIPSLNPTARVHIKGIDATSSNYALKVDNSANSPLLYVRNDGNVGFGTLSPSKTLTVISQGTNKMILGIGTNILSSPYDIVNTYSTGNGKIIYRDQSNITGYTDGLLHVDYLDATTLSLHSRWYDGTNGTENIRVAGTGTSWFNGGNVAIGTNSASAQLHIKGIDATSGNYALKVDNLAENPLLYVRNDGNVVIGDIASQNYFDFDPSLGYLTIQTSDSLSLYSKNSFAIGHQYNLIASSDLGSGSNLETYITNNYVVLNYSADILFTINASGKINASLLPTSNTGLSTGDLYVDTAANILANGDKVVGWKV